MRSSGTASATICRQRAMRSGPPVQAMVAATNGMSGTSSTTPPLKTVRASKTASSALLTPTP